MHAVHDPDFRRDIRARADSLTSASARRWGTMTVDQMLWHLNASFGLGLGKVRAAGMTSPMPRAIMRPVALYLPWPKGKVAAVPETRASGPHDLAEERQRFHVLVEEFASRPLHFNWLPHPMLGRLSGPAWSRLLAKHVDHHFRQFGV